MRRPCKGEAIEHCVEIANSYHKTDKETRVQKVREILEELGRVLLDPATRGKTPSEHVHQAGSSREH